MFENIAHFTVKATYVGLFALLFWGMLAAMLPAAESWLVAVAGLILASPLVVMVGIWVIGPLSLAAGIVAGAIASTTVALIRLVRY